MRASERTNGLCVDRTLRPWYESAVPPHRPRPRGPSPEPAVPPRPSPAGATRPWTFLTNHAHVLLILAAAPDVRMRDVAARVGVTERAVQRIVAELVGAGCISITRAGRRNRYTIHARQPLGHPLEAHRTVRDLLVLGPDPAPA